MAILAMTERGHAAMFYHGQDARATADERDSASDSTYK